MNFVVVGAGAWGTAFALHLARTGHSVALVPRRPDQALAIAAQRENPEYLPGVSLPPELVVTPDLTAAVAQSDVILLACPAQALRETSTRLRHALP
jgi:glycerol-3-phosphate dehydrogenase (NAD(P)+)